MPSAPDRQRIDIGYYACIDVFPIELSERICKHLNGGRKIHFGRTGARLTKSEQLLPDGDAYKCRELLDAIQARTRSVMFSPYRHREVPRHIAYALAKAAIAQGCTLYAAADALGYHYNSIIAWDIRKGTKAQFDPPGTPQERAAFIEKGKAHCEKVPEQRPGRSPTALHYAWVGWLREQVDERLKDMKSYVHELAVAGGPIDAAVAVYHLPATQLYPLGDDRWAPPAIMGPPSRNPTILGRLTDRGRRYCHDQDYPIRERLLPWVGWFLDLTAIEPAPKMKD